jgi:hypothetical protein
MSMKITQQMIDAAMEITPTASTSTVLVDGTIIVGAFHSHPRRSGISGI